MTCAVRWDGWWEGVEVGGGRGGGSWGWWRLRGGEGYRDIIGRAGLGEEDGCRRMGASPWPMPHPPSNV